MLLGLASRVYCGGHPDGLGYLGVVSEWFKDGLGTSCPEMFCLDEYGSRDLSPAY